MSQRKVHCAKKKNISEAMSEAMSTYFLYEKPIILCPQDHSKVEYRKMKNRQMPCRTDIGGGAAAR